MLPNVFMNQISVLLVENQALTRLGVKTVLERNDAVGAVFEAENTAAGLYLFGRMRPDVTILSLRLPDSCAVDSIQDFLRIAPAAKIIVFAHESGDAEIARAFERGAFGYVLKDVSPDELVRAIVTVRANKKFVPANVAGILSEHRADENLTASEEKILRLIVRGLSNKEIAGELEITENTVKTHVKNVLAKLSVNDRTHAATTAIRRGLVRGDI